MNLLTAGPAQVEDPELIQRLRLRSEGITILVAAFVALLALGYAPVLARQAAVHAWEARVFAVIGAGLGAAALSAVWRRTWVTALAPLAATVLAGLVLFRIAMLYVDDTFAAAGHGMFMPAHAFLPIAYLLFLVLLPSRQALRFAVLLWLVAAAIATVGSLPYFGQTPAKPYLLGTLIYLWPAQGFVLLLLGVWARHQRALAQANARLSSRTQAVATARARADARFRLVYEQGTAGIGLIDAEARWLDVNAQLAGMLGYTREGLIGMPLCALLPDAERDARRAAMQRFLATDPGIAPADIQGEGVWLHRDGHEVWLSRHLRRFDAAIGGDTDARAVLIAIDVTARVRAEAEARLQSLRERFQFEHLPLALIEWDRDLRVRRWSPQAEAMLGWSAAEVRGRTLREAGLLGDDEAAHHEGVMREFLSGRLQTIESIRRSRHRDGRLLWFRWTSHAMPGPDGRPLFFFTAGIDITALVENNRVLDENRRELRALFDQASVGIAMLDGDGRWLSVNRRLCEIVGRSEAELLATDFQSITHPDDLPLDTTLAAEVIRGERSGYLIEKRYLKPDGSTVWVRLNVGRIEASGSVPARFVSVVEDIGERRAAQDLAAEQRRIREFHYENTPLAVIEWTPELRVKRWSRRAEAMFGWSEEAVRGRHCDDWPFIHPDDRARLQEPIRVMFEGRQATMQVVHRNLHRDGHTVWCHWHNSVLHDAEGRVKSIYSMVDDVTAEQFTVAALRDSQARFQALFEQSAVGVAMIDPDGHWLMANARFAEIAGRSETELLAASCDTLVWPEDRAAKQAVHRRLLAGEIADYTLELRLQRPEAEPVWVALFARRLATASEDDSAAASAAGGVRLSLTIVDISARKQAETGLAQLTADLERRVAERTAQLQATLRDAAARNAGLRLLGELTGLLAVAGSVGEARSLVGSYLPQLFRHCEGSVWMLEGTDARQSLIADWTAAAADPAASMRRTANTVSAPALIGTEDCWALRRGQSLRIDDPAHPLQCQHLGTGPQAREPHACVPIVASGRPIGLISLRWSERPGAVSLPPDANLVRTVAEQIGLAIGSVEMREELRRQALRDPLTGLYNRRHFDAVLRDRIAEHARHGRGFALLALDIDHFKQINDTHGHDGGDLVLREVGALLARLVRAGEHAFRPGGEEFALLIDDSGPEAALGCAERIRSAIESLHRDAAGARLPAVTVSIGVARFGIDAGDGDGLVTAADAALYAAKRGGRNRAVLAAAAPKLAPVRRRPPRVRA